MIDKLKQLVEQSDRILITAHISPDADAFSSTVLLGATLRLNFPSKKIEASLEELPKDLLFIHDSRIVEESPLLDKMRTFKPELLILLDGNNYDRFSANDGEAVRTLVKKQGIKTVIIDHHQPANMDKTDVYINQHSPAVAQDIYEICFDHLNLKKPIGYAESTMLGIYSDTGGFAYANPRHEQTFKIINELLDQRVSIEAIRNRLNRYRSYHLQVLSEFIKNVQLEEDYCFSFLSDEFVEAWSQTMQELHRGAEMFVNDYIRNIEDREWGWVVYGYPVRGGDTYAVSFRAVSGTVDVSSIANTLGGGGHKPAAGAKIEAKNVNEAIEKVKTAINSLA